MKLNSFLTKAIFVTTISLGLFACSERTLVESDLHIKGAPDWVNEGTQAVSDDDGRLIQGIGMAPEMGDFSLQQSTADARARASIARVLSSYVESTMNDYTASAGGQMDASVDREIKTTTALALSGARILGHWKNRKNGDIFAFAELDMEQVDKTLKTATSLSEGFRKYYTRKAASGFDRFVEEKQE